MSTCATCGGARRESANTDCEPELMYREATILTSMSELFDAFGEPKERPAEVTP